MVESSSVLAVLELLKSGPYLSCIADAFLRVIPMGGGGLFSRFRRVPGFAMGELTDAPLSTWSAALPADVISALEARALWSRFGL